MHPRLALAPRALVLLVAAGTAAACGSSSGTTGAGSSPGSASTVSVTLNDDGCAPSPATMAAGPVTFKVKNSGGSKVSEVELVDGSKILGEKENVVAGLASAFSLKLEPGNYEVYCPGASTERTAFTVTGAASASGSDTSKAVAAYADYVTGQAAQLTAGTTAFVAAIKAGDLAKAQSLYAATRVPYERIEPVAESFGDLDPRIDARINDVPAGQFSGFHKLEQALFVTKSLAGTVPVATTLLADVKDLQARVATATYQPAELANGATGLLDEVAKSKVTGEEERYSHTDLVDFKANIDGAKEAFDLLRPTVASSDATLATTIDARFADLLTSLTAYKTPTGYVSYTKLTTAQVRTLAQQVDALAEPLSQVAAIVVKA